MALTEEIKSHVDAIMELLGKEGCNSNVAIRVNKGIGFLRLEDEDENYMHSIKGEWKKL